MDMEIIEEEKVSYRLYFDDARYPDSGYAFPCDGEGKILWDVVCAPEVAKKNLAYCKAHPERWTADSRDGRVVQTISRVRYGVCPRCGHRVYFGGSGWTSYMGTAECECGHWYTTFGQAIKPPEDDAWEEEDNYLIF